MLISIAVRTKSCDFSLTQCLATDCRQGRLINADITPNALLSILITIAKSSLLLTIGSAIGQLKWTYLEQRPQPLVDAQKFDNASRGPLGAIQLLFTVHWRASIASLAAIVTLLALPMDSFTQQTLSYPSILSRVPDLTSTIQTAYGLNLGMEAGLDSTIMNALTLDKQQPLFKCPSGDCRWPLYHSLGFCSTCEDVSQHVRRNCTRNLCTWTMPDNHSVTDYSIRVKTFVGESQDSISSAGPLSTTFASLSSLVSAYTLMNETLQGDNSVRVGPQAYQCKISWCVRSYAETRVVGGIFTEPSTASTPLTYSPCIYPKTYTRLDQCTGHVDDQDAASPGDVNGATQKSAHDTDVYLVNIATALRMQGQVLSALNLSDIGGAAQPSAMTGILSSPMPEIMENLAIGLTYWMRAGNNMATIEGSVYAPTTYVHVNWAWISYPVSVTIIAALLLIVTIIFSHEAHSVVWKSSSLALYFHGNSTVGSECKDKQTLKGMEASAAKIHVQVRRNAATGSTLAEIHTSD